MTSAGASPPAHGRVRRRRRGGGDCTPTGRQLPGAGSGSTAAAAGPLGSDARSTRRFVEQWPQLQDWFAAPLRLRLGCRRRRLFATGRPHGAPAPACLPDLPSLVHGVALDYDCCSAARSPARSPPRCRAGPGRGPGAVRVARRPARPNSATRPRPHDRSLIWPLGRMLLHRGDPDLTAHHRGDLVGSAARCDASVTDPAARAGRPSTPRSGITADLAPGQGSSAPPSPGCTPCMCCCSTSARSSGLPRSGAHPGTWTDRLASRRTLRAGDPRPSSSAICGCTWTRTSTARRPSAMPVTRCAAWSTGWPPRHPEITNLGQLRPRARRGVPALVRRTDQPAHRRPLAVTHRRCMVTLITRFCRETAAWGWDDVPGRVLFTRARHPRIPETLPRFIPATSSTALMTAIEALHDPLPARRADRRPLERRPPRRDPPPRHRLPRHLPRRAPAAADPGRQRPHRTQHPAAPPGRRRPTASSSTWPAAQRRPRRHDPSAGRHRPAPVRGPRQAALTAFPVRPRPPERLHRGRTRRRRRQSHRHARTGSGTPSAPSSPKAAPASRRSWPCSATGHPAHVDHLRQPVRPRRSSSSTKTPSTAPRADVIAGPAAEALREHRLDPDAVHWLQTNFLKTELELGHCLRLPAEGPCECDLVLTCSKFLTTSDYAPRLRARLDTEANSSPTPPPRLGPRNRTTPAPSAGSSNYSTNSKTTRPLPRRHPADRSQPANSARTRPPPRAKRWQVPQSSPRPPTRSTRIDNHGAGHPSILSEPR